MMNLARDAMRFAKGTVRAVLGSETALRVLQRAGPRRAAVFMFHRFAHPENGLVGASPDTLRKTLGKLRRGGVTLMSLRDLITRIETHERLPGPAAVFTVDDGYQDFAAVAAPIFAEFDCPVTTFLVTEFVEGKLWCWWDRIDLAFKGTPRKTLALECGGRTYHYAFGDADTRQRAATDFIEALKRVPDDERRRIVTSIDLLTDVPLPALPPPSHAAMTWEEVRRLEQSGFEFGPHTRTHPVLSRLETAASLDEVAGSWAHIQRECRNPLPVFCYPNGTSDSYGDREMDLVRAHGMMGAVAVYKGYVSPKMSDDAERYRLPRFSFSSDVTAAYVASGLARV